MRRTNVSEYTCLFNGTRRVQNVGFFGNARLYSANHEII